MACGSGLNPSIARSRGPGRPPCIRILDDMIENVSQSAPALAPLFRSQQQFRILAELFGDGAELSVGELAKTRPRGAGHGQ